MNRFINLLIAIGVLGIFASLVIDAPQRLVPPSVDPTTWPIYQNKEYGFEFRYPDDFSLQKKLDMAGIMVTARFDTIGSFTVNVNPKNSWLCEGSTDFIASTKVVNDIKMNHIICRQGYIRTDYYRFQHMGNDFEITVVDDERDGIGRIPLILSTFRFTER
ncbi:MAG: hypothetical protein AAB420_01795 [Patescibacteria group bacterium]